MDIADEPPNDLLAAMRAAADRDLVARQYVEDFRLVLEEHIARALAGRGCGWTLTDSIVHTHLSLIAQHGDSLIARKCGPEIAKKRGFSPSRRWPPARRATKPIMKRSPTSISGSALTATAATPARRPI